MRLSFFLLFFLVFLNINPVYANAETDSFNQGKQHFLNQNYDKAYEYLHQAFMEDPTNLDISFHLGRAAFMKGDYENALMAFDRILIMDPNATRIKLEIARCHMMLGANETAKMHFYEVLESNPPTAVKDNIELFLSSIAAKEKKHFLTGMLSFEFAFDDNVRTSPSVDTIDLYDTTGTTIILPDVILDPAAKEELFNTTIAASHIYRFTESPFSWKTSALGYSSLYTTYKDLDLTLAGLSSGVVYQGKSFLLEAYGLFNDINLAYDRYMQQTGAASTLSFALDPKLLISSMVGINKKKYFKDDSLDKDATNYNIRISPVLIIGENKFTFSISKERENSDAAYNSFDSHKWSLRYDSPKLIFDTALFTGIGVKNTNYDLRKPGEPVLRSDKVTDLTIGLNKKIWSSKNKSKSLSIQLKHTYTESDSTVETYTYRKNLTSSSMMFIF